MTFDLPERFWSKVQENPDTGCWEWLGYCNPKGYGAFKFEGKAQQVHRIAYRALVGEFEEPHLDHLCKVRRCCNPEHLEPVTAEENARRSPNGQAEKTHCPQQHPYSGDNLMVSPEGWRRCRACNIRKCRARRVQTKTSPGTARS